MTHEPDSRMEHLKHMRSVAVSVADRDAANWAVCEIGRLQTEIELLQRLALRLAKGDLQQSTDDLTDDQIKYLRGRAAARRKVWADYVAEQKAADARNK